MLSATSAAEKVCRPPTCKSSYVCFPLWRFFQIVLILQWQKLSGPDHHFLPTCKHWALKFVRELARAQLRKIFNPPTLWRDTTAFFFFFFQLDGMWTSFGTSPAFHRSVRFRVLLDELPFDSWRVFHGRISRLRTCDYQSDVWVIMHPMCFVSHVYIAAAEASFLVLSCVWPRIRLGCYPTARSLSSEASFMDIDVPVFNCHVILSRCYFIVCFNPNLITLFWYDGSFIFVIYYV